MNKLKSLASWMIKPVHPLWLIAPSGVAFVIVLLMAWIELS
ncbi:MULTISPECIES: hypothetical protein [unclassified Aeromonas]|nr:MULTISPECIES: hypothetical protein [unclassified Aeromonas]